MCPIARTYPSHPFLVRPSPAIAPFTPFQELNRNYLSLLTHVNCMKTSYKSLLISNRIQSSSVLLLLASRPLIRAPSLLRTYPSQSPTTIGSHCVRYTPLRPGLRPGLLSPERAYPTRMAVASNQPNIFGMMRPIFVEIICQT